jgi:cytochrome c peroxidase
MFEAAGFGEPSNGGIRNAIPEYLNTLISRNSPFDKGELSVAAARGQELFTGKAGCVACHSGSRFTDDDPHNVGTPENPEIWSDPMRHMTYAAFASFMGVENYMNVRRDVGTTPRPTCITACSRACSRLSPSTIPAAATIPTRIR